MGIWLRCVFLIYRFCVGVQSAAERIARRAPQFVNVPKDDGFTALHIAAVNGHVKTATVLIDTVRYINSSLFTARCTLVQSAVLRSYVVCPSVRLSVRPSECDVQVS